MTPVEQATECYACKANPLYFIWNYVQIFDPQKTPIEWFPFQYWPAQQTVLEQLWQGDSLIVLKARQLGLTWLCLAYALWLAIFRPGSQILIYSRTDMDAVELLNRLKQMYQRLPRYLQANRIETDNDHEFTLSNGSKARSFTTTKNSGRGTTASFLIIDEADFIAFLRELLAATLPAIEHGGQGVIISTSDKEKPGSRFKQMWRKARAGDDDQFKAVFLPWSARPTRTKEWYEAKRQAAQTIHELDDLYQEYPDSPEESMAGRRASKRFSPEWLTDCFEEATAVTNHPLTLPGLALYQTPQPKRKYLIAVDTCEGDPTSDPSPATIFDTETWEEVGHLFGRFEPSTLAIYCHQLSTYYNNAVICPERNNHGHAVIMRLKDLEANIYKSPLDKKLGWLSSSKNKTMAVDKVAEVLKNQEVIIHTEATKLELADLEANTLKAPEGNTDDRAMSYIIGIAALVWPTRKRQDDTPRQRPAYSGYAL